MAEKVEIRDCTEGDLPAVQRIEEASFDDPYPPSLFLRLLEDYSHGFRVAVAGEELVGYCVLVNKNNKGVIASLAVRPDFRRRSIGEMLLEDAIRIAREALVNSIELQVRVENSSAISLYSKFGFKTEGRIRNYYGRGKDGLLMTKRL